MKLTRDIGAVVVGIAFSVLLMSAGGWSLARSLDTRVLFEEKERSDKGIAPTKAQAEQLFTSLERQVTYMRWVMGPVVVFLTGVVAGVIAVRAKPILGALSAAPYSVVMTSFATDAEYAVLALYLAIAAIGGSVPILMRRMKSSNQAL